MFSIKSTVLYEYCLLKDINKRNLYQYKDLKSTSYCYVSNNIKYNSNPSHMV